MGELVCDVTRLRTGADPNPQQGGERTTDPGRSGTYLGYPSAGTSPRTWPASAGASLIRRLGRPLAVPNSSTPDISENG